MKTLAQICICWSEDRFSNAINRLAAEIINKGDTIIDETLFASAMWDINSDVAELCEACIREGML